LRSHSSRLSTGGNPSLRMRLRIRLVIAPSAN
jgi:hypothetical protein